MKDYILNKVALKTGDSLDIVESSTLPLTEKLMYKVEHEKDKIVVRRDGRNLIIPVENILFASSIPLDVIHVHSPEKRNGSSGLTARRSASVERCKMDVPRD